MRWDDMREKRFMQICFALCVLYLAVAVGVG